MLGGADHEAHLGPLTAKFMVADFRFLFLAVLPVFRFGHAAASEREKQHSGKIRECRLMFLFDRNKKPKARNFQEKSRDDSHSGKADIAEAKRGSARTAPVDFMYHVSLHYTR
jgi:hypothetical protein